MKKLVSIILVALFALMIFTGCGNSGVEENMDNMAENGSVADGDGIIGNEEGKPDDNKAPTVTMPTVTMPGATAPANTDNSGVTETSTGLLDNVL